MTKLEKVRVKMEKDLKRVWEVQEEVVIVNRMKGEVRA